MTCGSRTSASTGGGRTTGRVGPERSGGLRLRLGRKLGLDGLCAREEKEAGLWLEMGQKEKE
jgi:hypothetical protein